ncbi:MAG: methyltransferase domain-containing protein [Theionarchaea archaeon]|nr:methyltransferase domain-containing protein [Theionarchaea archaeon]
MEEARKTYYDIVGSWNTPIIHMGGLSATCELLKLLNLKESMNVLEIACGTGFTACMAAHTYHCQITAVDYSEEMIKKARERAKKEHIEDYIEFKVANVFDLPFEDNTFEVAYFESFLNILAGDKEKALKEITRVVRPGGFVGANEVFRTESIPPELLRHMEEGLAGMALGPGENLGRFTPREWRECFEQSGLTVSQTVEKKTESSPISVTDLVHSLGIWGFFSFIVKVCQDVLIDADLRASMWKAAPVRRMMHSRATRSYFGYILLVGKKMK